MEIRELNLAAFGPFSDRLLDFSTAGSGLHIVYGPNEAGKSSSLRGLKALLFGIPGRTSDNFRHENKDLRIRGTLCNRNGHELRFVRRKGNKNTLLSPDGGLLGDAALAPFLHGVSAEVFEMLFGIDHEALVRGGQEILEQKGEVGQALFAASMGSAALHAVLGQLESEADALFKPRGSTPAINAALRQHAEIQKAIKVRSLSAREWGEARRTLENTNQELTLVEQALAQAKAERNLRQRIRRALPKIVARRDFLTKFEALGEVVVLAGDFGRRREAATRELEAARATANSARTTLEGLQDQLAAISVNNAVLELEEAIEDLHARVGGHRKAMQDRPHLEAERSQLRTDAEALLNMVRPDLSLADAEALRPVVTRGVRITELGNHRQALTVRVTQSEKALRDTRSKLQQARDSCEALAEAGVTDALQQQIRLARKRGDLDAALLSAREERDRLQLECKEELSRLGTIWRGALDDIPCLPLPARESLDRFEQAYADLEQRNRRYGDQRDEQADAARAVQQQLDEIHHAGAVPTEGDLMAIRAGRDRAWGLLRRKWLEGEPVDAEARTLDPERPLPEAFETRVVDADDMADRLRREADRVQKQASLVAALADARRRTEGLDSELQECVGQRQRLDGEWMRLWETTGVTPLSPREMRAWLDRIEKLRSRITELKERKRQVSELEAIRKGHDEALRQELQVLGESPPETRSLEALLVESETQAARLDELGRKRRSLDTEIKDLESKLETTQFDLQEAMDALDTWKREWQAAIGDLGLNANALPAEVADTLENIRGLFAKLTEAEKLRIRIHAIDTDAQAFRDAVAGVAERVAPELAALPVDDAVARLTRLLADARQDDTRRRQLESQVREAQENIKAAAATRKTMTERLDALCKEAQCSDAMDLETAERRSIDYLSLKRNIESLEQELREIGEGMPLTELEKQADAADPNTLPGEIDFLTARIDKELEPNKTELAVAKGERQKELDLMDGSGAAAALAEEAQSLLVGVRSDAEQYVRVKLAARILRNEIERYRQQHQGPLLERASEHFAVLTESSFAGLRADFNEKDEPVLIGLRPDGERVYVEGMSSGTRDQLYLALRLASLEKYMESAEPMPFIVDDILVHFDDERAKATLGVLAGLAAKTQIILFTHHRRLVEQARALGADPPVTVHEL